MEFVSVNYGDLIPSLLRLGGDGTNRRRNTEEQDSEKNRNLLRSKDEPTDVTASDEQLIEALVQYRAAEVDTAATTSSHARAVRNEQR